MNNNNKEQRIATFDIETNGLLETVTQVWCICIKDHSTLIVDSYGPDSIERALSVLSTYDGLVGHNSIAFDFPVLRKLYGWEYEGNKIDTLIMSRTQRPKRTAPKGTNAGPHSVEAWGRRLGRGGLDKIQNEVWDHFHPRILERCQRDVEIQDKIYQALLEEGKEEGWELAHRLNFKLFDLLQRQEEYGWYIDSDKLNYNIRTLNRWITRIDNTVKRSLPLIVERLEKRNEDGSYAYVQRPFKRDGTYNQHVMRYWDGTDYLNNNTISGPYSRIHIRPVDINSNLEIKNFLLKQGWEPKEWNTNDAGERTSPKFSKDDPFEGIQGSLGRLIAKRVQCRHRLSTLEGWRDLIRRDGRISAKVGGIASTGRLTHKDIVNVPSPHSKAFFAKQMREVFSARPGYLLVGIDSKGNQIRQLAARMQDEEFTQAVLYGKSEDGTDIHSVNQRRSGAPSRSQAKNFFYGFIFGAGPKKIASTIKISVEAAKQLIETYLSELPGLRKLITSLTDEWKKSAQKYYSSKFNKWIYKDGYIKGLDGRPVLVDSEHKILCYALQSDEAIQMAAAYVKMHADMYAAGYKYGEDWGSLIWMHDEFQIECRSEIAEKAAKIGCRAIEWAGKFYKIKCPHEGEYKIGRNWKETH